MSSQALSSDQVLDAQQDLESLRNEALRAINIGLFVLANLWVAYVTFVVPDSPFTARMGPAGLFLACGLTLGLSKTSPLWARRLLPLELLLLVFGYLSFQPDTLAVFLVVPILVLASVIVDRRWLLVVTGVTCLVLVGLLWRNHWALWRLYGMAILVNVLAAAAAWLATENLYVAIQWAMYSQRKAQESVETLRGRRAELRQLSDMLRHNQDRMHYLNVRLEQAKVAAEEAYRTKQHFVANVSHELRTPLNLITGFSEMMAFSPESYGGVRLPAPYQEDVMEIYRSSKHLLGLVEDVLALAQLEAGQMIVQREWTDPCAVIHEATDTLRPLIEAKGLELDISVPEQAPSVFVDAGRIRQVLLNLLNNAYRFTERGAIRVALRCSDSEATIEVRDSGVGIAPADLPRVFEEFNSLSGAPSARRDGFGLGLSISRRLVQAHGGRLWAESTLGSGSAFFLSLPFSADGASLGRPTLVHTTPKGPAEQSRPVILQIGQEPGFEMFDRHLNEYQIVHARPEQAVMAYERYLPVAIWVNDHLGSGRVPRYLAPVMRLGPSLPIIACRMPTAMDVAYKLQADYFLAKPITRSKLEEMLHRLAQERPIESVLIIDDEPSMVRLIERTLLAMPEAPRRIIGACGGSEGLELLASEAPDLILLDLAMPEISGYDVLEALHTRYSDLGMRVVLMTGVGLDEAEMPVYAVSVQSQAGFSFVKSLDVIKAMVEGLSGKIIETAGPQDVE